MSPIAILSMTMKTTVRIRNNPWRKLKVSLKQKGAFKSNSFMSIVKEEPKKKLTKKELKAIEDAEFEAALAGVTQAAPVEEKKEEAAKVGEGNSKN